MTAAVATAPVRVGDVGGWTDTWFGAPGQVCHVAVGPGVQARAELVRRASGEPQISLEAPSVGINLRFDLVADPDPRASQILDSGGLVARPSREVLLEQAVAVVLERSPLPADVGIDLRITSAVPSGASLGTSAAVLVTVIGVLDHLLSRGGRLGLDEIARLAHQCETERAGREAGVQDQWAAAFGGCGHLTIGPYPEVRRHRVEVPADAAAALREQLVTVVFGPHDSSAVHGEVIEALVGCGGAAHDRARAALRVLSTLADQAAENLEAGNLEAWGQTLIEATAGQRQLHDRLIGPAHQQAIDLARSQGATGWKVNGAGGNGGSLTVLASDVEAADALAVSLAGADPSWTVVDLKPAPGLEVHDA